jgi:hypothetical protein
MTLFRCFRFHDFQLAPTLEELEQILGYSLKESTLSVHRAQSFFFLNKHDPSLKMIDGSLKIPISELEGKKINEGNYVDSQRNI